MRFLLFILLSFSLYPAFAQPTPLYSKMAELEAKGKKLYNQEITAWQATDEYVAMHANSVPTNTGGYFSYPLNDAYICVFYSNDSNVKVLASFRFDSTATLTKKDLSTRDFTEIERTYYKVRKKALELAYANNFFAQYKNIEFNVIPQIDNAGARAYLLTPSMEPGTILFGNDYLITFDKDLKPVSKNKLHNDLTPLAVNDTNNIKHFINPDDPPSYNNLVSLHIHKEGDSEFMTETDICTLMLYGHNDIWRYHASVSKNYMSSWDCKDNKLVILRMR